MSDQPLVNDDIEHQQEQSHKVSLIDDNAAYSQDRWYFHQRFQSNMQDFNETIKDLQKCKERQQAHSISNSHMHDGSGNIDRKQRIQEMLRERRNKSLLSSSNNNNNNNGGSQTLLSPPLSANKSAIQYLQHNPISRGENCCSSSVVVDEASKRISTFQRLNSTQNWQFSRMLGFQEILEPSESENQQSYLPQIPIELQQQQQQQQHSQQSPQQQQAMLQQEAQHEHRLDFKHLEQPYSPFNEKQQQSFHQHNRLFNPKELPADRIESSTWDLSAIYTTQKPQQQHCSFIEECKLQIKGGEDDEEEVFLAAVAASENNNQNFYPNQANSNRGFLQACGLGKPDECTQNALAKSNSKNIEKSLDLINSNSGERISVQALFAQKNGHFLPIEDRLYVKNIAKEARMQELKEEEEKKVQQSLLSVPRISKSSDAIARNSSRFQQNPVLVDRLLNDQRKRDEAIAKAKVEQERSSENQYSFAPVINSQSAQLDRSVQNLFQWDQKKKIKQQQAVYNSRQQEEEIVNEMQSKVLVCKGSQAILSNQSRTDVKVEDRLLREGQSMQIRKEIATKAELDRTKDKSIFLKQSLKKRTASMASSQSQLSISSKGSQKQQQNKRQQSCLSLSNISNFTQAFQNSSPLTDSQDQLNNKQVMSPSNAQLQIIRPTFFQDNVQKTSSQLGVLSRGTTPTHATASTPLSTGIVATFYDENTHPNTQTGGASIAGHSKIQQISVDVNPRRIAYSSNEYKKTEKIMMPASQNGRTSVESLIQSSLFRKTKIFASDSQTTLIIDKGNKSISNSQQSNHNSDVLQNKKMNVNIEQQQPQQQQQQQQHTQQLLQQQQHNQQRGKQQSTYGGNAVIQQIKNERSLVVKNYQSLFERKKLNQNRATSIATKNIHPFLSN